MLMLMSMSLCASAGASARSELRSELMSELKYRDFLEQRTILLKIQRSAGTERAIRLINVRCLKRIIFA
jgi:hypothetical protein